MSTKKTTKKTTSKKSTASNPKKATSTRQKRAATRTAPAKTTPRPAGDKKHVTSGDPTKQEVCERLLELVSEIESLQAEYDQLRAGVESAEIPENQVDSAGNED